MNKIIPFSKDITFDDLIGEITSIALDDDLSFEDKYTIKGEFVVKGRHKIGDIEDDFSISIPVLVSMDDKYDTSSAKITVDDFYYEIINDNILRVKIDLLLDNLFYQKEEIKEPDDLETNKTNENNNEVDPNLFQNTSDTKEYSIYLVYTITENDTIDTVLNKYNITKEELELYNDLTNWTIGMKLIIPSTDEQ